MAATLRHDPFASLRSVYRLFLRASSATVLHQARGTRRLRKLYRPYFRDASQVMQTMLREGNTPALTTWLNEWHKRMDNTLKMFYTSAKSRGQSHELTSNLAILLIDEQKRLDSVPYKRWNPRLPPDSPEYQPYKRKPKKVEEEEKLQAMKDRAAGLLGQAIMMAEGSQHLSLGRIRNLKKKPREYPQ